MVLACAAAGALWYVSYATRPLLEIVHLPEVYARRAGDFTANVVGRLSPEVRSARYRLNGGPWRELRFGPKRNFDGQFTIELAADELAAGHAANVVVVEADAPLRRDARAERVFGYAPDPIGLPLTVEWSRYDVDSQDGFWETVETERGVRLRPRPGSEGYDRILAVTGAFAQGRRIRTDVVFRSATRDARSPTGGVREWGFGVFSLWGGHPDDGSHRPRRGWSFSLGWYWTKPGGVGGEMSFKRGEEAPKWVNTYRDYTIREDVAYNILIEAFPERDREGRHRLYRQRFKWWAEDESAPLTWMELTDVEGAVLPGAEYAVALMAYNCQVEFGPVTVEEVAPRRPRGERR